MFWSGGFCVRRRWERGFRLARLLALLPPSLAASLAATNEPSGRKRSGWPTFNPKWICNSQSHRCTGRPNSPILWRQRTETAFEVFPGLWESLAIPSLLVPGCCLARQFYLVYRYSISKWLRIHKWTLCRGIYALSNSFGNRSKLAILIEYNSLFNVSSGIARKAAPLELQLFPLGRQVEFANFWPQLLHFPPRLPTPFSLSK